MHVNSMFVFKLLLLTTTNIGKHLANFYQFLLKFPDLTTTFVKLLVQFTLYFVEHLENKGTISSNLCKLLQHFFPISAQYFVEKIVNLSK